MYVVYAKAFQYAANGSAAIPCGRRNGSAGRGHGTGTGRRRIGRGSSESSLFPHCPFAGNGRPPRIAQLAPPGSMQEYVGHLTSLPRPASLAFESSRSIIAVVFAGRASGVRLADDDDRGDVLVRKAAQIMRKAQTRGVLALALAGAA